jgi:hypothetical protein
MTEMRTHGCAGTAFVDAGDVLRSDLAAPGRCPGWRSADGRAAQSPGPIPRAGRRQADRHAAGAGSPRIRRHKAAPSFAVSRQPTLHTAQCTLHSEQCSCTAFHKPRGRKTAYFRVPTRGTAVAPPAAAPLHRRHQEPARQSWNVEADGWMRARRWQRHRIGSPAQNARGDDGGSPRQIGFSPQPWNARARTSRKCTETPSGRAYGQGSHGDEWR